MATTLASNILAPSQNKGAVSETPLDAGRLAYLAADNAAIGVSEVLDDFWKPIDFDVVRWDKMYP